MTDERFLFYEMRIIIGHHLQRPTLGKLMEDMRRDNLSQYLSESSRLLKQQDKPSERLMEISVFAEKTERLVDVNINLGLDDGVKVNYAKFYQQWQKYSRVPKLRPEEKNSVLT